MIRVFRHYLSRKFVNPLRIRIYFISINALDQPWIKELLIKARRRSGKLEEYYVRAILAYALNRSHLGQFALAIKALDHLNIDTIGLARLHTAAMLYDVSGEIERRDACLLKVESLELDARATTQVEKLGCKIFGATFRPIGHTALIEIFIKAKLLGLTPNYRYVICEEKDKFANFALVEYWQRYCELITVPSTVKKLQEALGPCEEKLGHIRMCDGTTLNLDQFGMRVQLEWEKSPRESLLKLKPEHLERGWKYLYSLGMPKDSWFVGLHVRNTISSLSDIRNANIESYTLAIDEISARGGWVVRLGAKGDERIKSSTASIIDYASRSDKEDWLDVFMLAIGRFLIGTGSGPSAIPISFGSRVLYTNWGPLQNRQWGSADLLIPKQYWNRVEKRYLSMYERMGDHSIGRAQSKVALLGKGIEVHDNSPEILRDAVIEMLVGSAESSVECARQKQFRDLCLLKQAYPTRLSAGFIYEYPSFFEADYPQLGAKE